MSVNRKSIRMFASTGGARPKMEVTVSTKLPHKLVSSEGLTGIKFPVSNSCSQ